MLEGTVEIDETFVGGKNKNRHASKKAPKSQGRSHVDKAAVVGLLQRDGNVRTFVVENTNTETLHGIMLANVKPESKIVTDSFRGYNGLSTTYNHVAIKHIDGNYVTVGDDHTNSIEGFWSILKRGVIGIYHYVSPKHLHRYCHEFGYRHNTRKISDVVRFEDSFQKNR